MFYSLFFGTIAFVTPFYGLRNISVRTVAIRCDTDKIIAAVPLGRSFYELSRGEENCVSKFFSEFEYLNCSRSGPPVRIRLRSDDSIWSSLWYRFMLPFIQFLFQMTQSMI